MRIELGHPGVLDADLLAKELHLLVDPVVVGRQPNAGVDAVGGPTPSARDGVVSQREDCRTPDLMFLAQPEDRGMSETT